MMLTPPEVTESLESIILDQLRQGDKFAGEINVPGFKNRDWDPWEREMKRQLLEQLESRQKVHRTWLGRIPGRWRVGPGPNK
jgi:hypothetical protein